MLSDEAQCMKAGMWEMKISKNIRRRENLNKRHLSKANVIVMIVLSLFISY